MIAWLVALALAGEAPISVTAVTPVDAAKARVQVVVSGDADAALKASPTDAVRPVIGAGSARVEAVRSMQGEPTSVVLAFDQSGSFRTWWKPAFTLARSWADAMPAGTAADVALFGVELTDAGQATDAAGLRKVLDGAEARGAIQGWTRLRNFIREAAGKAAKAAPLPGGGLRQVIVFTDAGEESTAFSIDDVIDTARDLGVRIDIVAFVAKGGNVARKLDDVKRIAEGTGGAFIQVDDMDRAAAELKTLAGIAARAWWVDLSFCGVPTDRGVRFDDRLEIEVWRSGARLAASSPAALRQQATAPATDACDARPSAPPAPEPPVPAPVRVEPAWKRWLPWIAGIGGAFLLLLLPLLWFTRRRPPPASAPAVTPPTPPAPPPVRVANPEPDVSPFAPTASAAGDALERLPELHLVLVQGPPGTRGKVRLNQRTLTVGATPGNDVHLDLSAVSGRHATVQLFPNGNVYVRDEGSTNGTFVEGHKLAAHDRRKVEPGQQIAFSRQVVYRLERPQGAAEAVAPPTPPPAPRPKSRTIIAPALPPPGRPDDPDDPGSQEPGP